MSPMDPPQRRGPRLSGGAGDVVARPPEPKAWKVGSTVQGKYLLQELLDRGGSADVFRAENGFTHQAVAIKILHAHLVGIRGLAERMHQEAMLMARVKHPNHVLIYDGGIIDGVVFIVMELLEGRNLRRLLLAEGRLDVERALFIVSKAADGLIAAHNEGVTHRDMKPENTFLTYRNEVKLFDFGIAKYRKAIGPRLTDDGKSPGTIPYMSPEQLAGRMVDHRTDIFALSVILLELLLGHHPFASGPYEWPLNEEELKNRMRDWDVTSFRTLVPDLSDDVWAIIEKAGQRDPAARFRTMEEMKEAIDAAEHAAKIRRMEDRIGLAHDVDSGVISAIASHALPLPSRPAANVVPLSRRDAARIDMPMAKPSNEAKDPSREPLRSSDRKPEAGATRRLALADEQETQERILVQPRAPAAPSDVAPHAPVPEPRPPVLPKVVLQSPILSDDERRAPPQRRSAARAASAVSVEPRHPQEEAPPPIHRLLLVAAIAMGAVVGTGAILLHQGLLATGAKPVESARTAGPAGIAIAEPAPNASPAPPSAASSPGSAEAPSPAPATATANHPAASAKRASALARPQLKVPDALVVPDFIKESGVPPKGSDKDPSSPKGASSKSSQRPSSPAPVGEAPF